MPDSALVHGFRKGQIAGGWELAPADARLVAAGGRVLVNEASLWPGGRFSTAVLVVTQQLLRKDPGAVSGLLRGQLQADDFIAATGSRRRRRGAGAGRPAAPPAAGGAGRSFAQMSFTS